MITFRVHGTPTPQGSKRIGRHGAHPVILDANDAKLKPWREAVKWAALQEGFAQLTGPVIVDITFYLPRPRGHYGTGKNADKLRTNAPEYPATKPDLDKLGRSTLDALTDAGVFVDDARVVDLNTRKRYAVDGKPGAVVWVDGAA